MKGLRYNLIVLLSFLIVMFSGPGFAAKPLLKSNSPVMQVRQGYCCVNGQVISANEKTCKGNKGIYFVTRAEADKECKANIRKSITIQQSVRPLTGYCCDEGAVTVSTQSSCRKYKGTYFQSQSQAERSCGATRGFCCDEGIVAAATKAECAKKKGVFNVSRTKAEKICGAFKGYCCVDGRVASSTKQDCDRKKGVFRSRRRDAEKNCKNVTPVLPKKQSNSRKKAISTTLGRPMLRPLGQPDLDVTRTWLDDQCIMHVDIKNNGGLIADENFNKARVHISAGPGNTLPGAKQYLRVVDSSGNLKKAGGKVSFNTGLVLSGSQATLVWLDNGHHIQESNEQNNGDDQELICKSKLVKAELKVSPVVLGKVFIEQQPVSPIPDQLYMPRIADLAITDISIDRPSPKLAESFMITVTIRNNGPDDWDSSYLPAWFQMELTDDPYMQYIRNVIAPFSMPIQPLLAYEEHIITQSIAIPRIVQNVPVQSGAYKLLGIINTSAINPGTMNEELGGANNEFTKHFVVRDPTPSDLVLKNLSLTSDCHLVLTIKNEGNAIPDEDFIRARVRVEKSPTDSVNDRTEHIDLSSVDPNELLKSPIVFWGPQIQIVYIWPNNPYYHIGLLPGQTASYEVAVDPYHAIRDDNWGNNTRTKSLTCPQ